MLSVSLGKAKFVHYMLSGSYTRWRFQHDKHGQIISAKKDYIESLQGSMVYLPISQRQQLGSRGIKHQS